MSKAYSEKEREAIKNALIEIGKAHFIQYGLKKTTIDEITRDTGISKGGFYSFFDSKEELYFSILEIEESFRGALIERVKKITPVKKAFRVLIEESLRHIEQSDFLRAMYIRNEQQALMRKIPAKRMRAHIENDARAGEALVGYWKKKGVLRIKETSTIIALMRAFFVLTLHKKEIGEDEYSAVMHEMIVCLTEGIFNHRGEKI